MSGITSSGGVPSTTEFTNFIAMVKFVQDAAAYQQRMTDLHEQETTTKAALDENNKIINAIIKNRVDLDNERTAFLELKESTDAAHKKHQSNLAAYDANIRGREDAVTLREDDAKLRDKRWEDESKQRGEDLERREIDVKKRELLIFDREQAAQEIIDRHSRALAEFKTIIG